MEIVITDQLKEYMEKKNKKDLTIDLPMRKVCCSGPYLPFVRFGKPRKEGYESQEKQGYTIHINKEIKYAKNEIHLGVRKFLFAEEIYSFDPDTICVCGGYVKP